VYSDFNKIFKLYIDTLDIGLEAVLMQKDDQGKDQVICYKAKTLLLVEKNYLITEKGCLVIIWAMQKFKYFLREGQLFEIYINYTMLKILMMYKNPLSYKTRWIEKIVPFNFTIYYRSEVKIDHADFALRMDMFLSKNSTSTLISTLKKQKLPYYLQPK